VNNNYKYKAYISYSHRDEEWAVWLHRALESYRVPRKLVGTKTTAGKVPARIKPVFRDRDDLSSASDLGDTVKQALEDSENMIVLCSPDATASHWVNEEIRQFARLGRQKQIFCVIVDGDPGSSVAASTCFPEALAEIGLLEPLAADIRKWADGKRLSKLKLVAGMLGLPLDQLRRRELQKRQKVWTLTAIASVALAAVLVIAITARIAAQQRRDSGESLVAFKLKELRTMLNVSDDPENLGRLQKWSHQDLARLAGYAGVGKDALADSAMALRGQGINHWENGDLTEALEKFQQSWALLALSYRDDRDNHLNFFELGQAEYWIGQTYQDQGNLDAAEIAYMSYAEITRRLILLQPENAEWVMEMAYALTNLGLLHMSRGTSNPDRTLQFMQSSLEYNQIALVLDPANDYYQSELGQSNAYLADAQLDVCDLEGALRSRQEQVALDNRLLKTDPESVDRIHRMAFALTGLAWVSQLNGDIDKAVASLKKALNLLDTTLPTQTDIRGTMVDILLREKNLASLMTYNGDIDEAWALSNEMSDKWLELESISVEDMRTSLTYIDYLIGRARLADIRGNSQLANQLLGDIQMHLAAAQSNDSFKRRTENMLVKAAFQFWEMSGELPQPKILSHLPEYEAGSGRARACEDASMAVYKAVMLGQDTTAREFTDYLLQNGYREADFMRVCRQYSLCAGQ
jgi:tetratricopeptide (TPR) repeat protein